MCCWLVWRIWLIGGILIPVLTYHHVLSPGVIGTAITSCLVTVGTVSTVVRVLTVKWVLMLTDKPFSNLRNLIHGDDESLPRHGTPQPKKPENRVEALLAIQAIHQGNIPFGSHASMGVDDVH